MDGTSTTRDVKMTPFINLFNFRDHIGWGFGVKEVMKYLKRIRIFKKSVNFFLKLNLFSNVYLGVKFRK